MAFRATIIWVLGLLTAVPYGVYHLFYHAAPDQYALLITLILFWVFGYWGVVGPLLALLKVRTVFASLEKAHAQGTLPQSLQSKENADAIIDVIASENGIPRFLAAKVYHLLITHLAAAKQKPPSSNR